jgi:hypothetical protein
VTLIAAMMSALIGTVPAVRIVEAAPVGTVAPAVATTVVYSGRCAQWEQTALDAGWTLEQWPTVDRVMWCESKCEPDAYNRSGASGLMQVLRRWFAAGEDPFDPATNLAVALRVWHAQGWRAWSCV